MILSKIEVLKSMCGVSLSKRSSQKRVFVCGINDENLKVSRKEDKKMSHISIDRSNGRKKKKRQ